MSQYLYLGHRIKLETSSGEIVDGVSQYLYLGHRIKQKMIDKKLAIFVSIPISRS